MLEFVIIALCRFCLKIRFCISTDAKWTAFHYNDKLRSSPINAPWTIANGAISNGKIYVISSQGKIGVLNLNSPPNMTPLEVECIANLKGEPCLLGYDQKLLLIDKSGSNFEVYELNFLKMEWVKMSNFKDQALFLGFSKNSRFSSITRSNDSQQSSNCTYSFGLEGDYILLEMLDCSNHECSRLPFMRRKYIRSSGVLPSWYIPSQSFSVED